jgi:hypothetical protein
VTVFGSCRDEALNNLADELATRGGQVVGQGSSQRATERNQP